MTSFSDDAVELGDSLLKACVGGHTDTVKWMLNKTAGNVNYAEGKFTSLTTACY